MIRFFLFLLSAGSVFAHATLIYKPAKLEPKSARVLVVIHGCLQSSESMSMGTGFNQIAESNNVLVIYPQVPLETHPLDCWSWYLPTNQIKESGQLKIVHDEIDQVKKSFGVTNAPTYLAGMSSGGAMVSGLVACFGADYKGAAIIAAPLYGSARSLSEGERVLKNGPPPTLTWRPCQPANFEGRLLVIHGANDKVVNYNTGRAHVRDTFPNLALPAPQRLEANGMKYIQADYRDKNGIHARYIEVDDLGHMWPGTGATLRHPPVLTGKIEIPFFQTSGPSATNLIWEFIKAEPIRIPKIKKVAPNKDLEAE